MRMHCKKKSLVSDLSRLETEKSIAFFYGVLSVDRNATFSKLSMIFVLPVLKSTLALSIAKTVCSGLRH